MAVSLASIQFCIVTSGREITSECRSVDSGGVCGRRVDPGPRGPRVSSVRRQAATTGGTTRRHGAIGVSIYSVGQQEIPTSSGTNASSVTFAVSDFIGAIGGGATLGGGRGSVATRAGSAGFGVGGGAERPLTSSSGGARTTSYGASTRDRGEGSRAK